MGKEGIRDISGFVCMARTDYPDEELLFGPRVGKKLVPQNYERFCANNLTPFSSLEEARVACGELRKRQIFKSVGIAQIHLRVAPREEDISYMQDEGQKFILISETDDGVILLGKSVEGVSGVAYAPVSDLELNGFQAIEGLEWWEVLYSISEVERQGRLPTRLATFELQRISED